MPYKLIDCLTNNFQYTASKVAAEYSRTELKIQMSNLAYTTHGDPSLPAVMLVHGFMSCAGQWWANLDRLSAEYFLVNVELWGHGSSAEPDDLADYSVTGYARAFEAIRIALQIDRWFVVGQSYGAGVVINYALQHPRVCRGIVATNSRSAFGSLNAQSATDSPFNKPDFSLRQLPYHPIHARRFPETIKAELVRCADAMTVAAIRNGGRLGADLNFRQRLHLIHHPLLLANGVYEKSFQDDLAVLRTSYPDLYVVDMPGGHSVNIEAAEEFDAACLRFFHDISRGEIDTYRLNKGQHP